MKILHIADFGISERNGISGVVLSLSEAQRKLNHDVQVVLIRENQDCGLIPVRKTIRGLISFISGNIPECVVFHTFYKWQYPIIAMWLRKKRIPYFIEMHGGSTKMNFQKSHRLKTFMNLLAFNRFAHKAASIIYLNEEEQNNSIYQSGIIIPNGVHSPRTISDKKPERKIVLLFLGRIDFHHKGLDLLIQALQQQDKIQSKNIVLKLYGYRYDDRIVEIAANSNGLIEYHDAVYGIDKENAFLSADIFVHTSRYEGMPLSILEALSYGIPCLVTPQTNMANLIKKADAGWVTESNVEAIKHSLSGAINDYKRRSAELHHNASSSVDMYRWNKIAALSVEKYLETIEDRPTFG